MRAQSHKKNLFFFTQEKHGKKSEIKNLQAGSDSQMLSERANRKTCCINAPNRTRLNNPSTINNASRECSSATTPDRNCSQRGN